MDFTELVIAGVTRDLSAPAEGLADADAIAYPVRTSDDFSALESHEGLPIIVCTWSINSGTSAAHDEIVELLTEAANYPSTDAVEVPFEVLESDSGVIEAIRETDTDLIIAFRDYDGTPDVRTLIEVIETAAMAGDLVYLETMAESPDDTLTLLRTINEATESGFTVGGACMGSIGKHTRVVSPSYGSKLAYAPISEDTDIGTPGQIPIGQLVELIQESEDPSTSTSLHPKLSNQLENE